MNKLEGRYWHFIDNIEPTTKSPEILLWVALPLNHTGQKVEIQVVQPEPIEIIEDKVNGNQVIFWRITNLNGKDNMWLWYDFVLYYEEVNIQIDVNKIEPYDKSSKEYQRYTISEPWIEITPDIAQKAEDIIRGESNPYYQAKKIFYWVRDNMTYEFPDMEHRGADWAFRTLKGDCGEFSHLFDGLCRAIGIPARNVLSAGITTHEWAEFLLPPYGWVPVDTTRAKSVKRMIEENREEENREEELQQRLQKMGISTKDPDYFFGNLYPSRLIVNIGNNIELTSKKMGIKRAFKFMQPGGNVAYPSAVELKGLSKKTVTEGFYILGDGRSDEALAHTKAERELTPFYLKTQAYNKAERGALTRLKETPNDSTGFFYLAQVYLHTNKIDEALDTFEKSIAGKKGDLKEATDTWSHNLIGSIYDLRGMRDKAVTEYNKAIKLGTDYDGAINYAQKHTQTPVRNLKEIKIVTF